MGAYLTLRPRQRLFGCLIHGVLSASLRFIWLRTDSIVPFCQLTQSRSTT